jgi:ABC-2 type transport system permease protein
MAYTPLAIYIGTIQGSAIWTSILNQYLWGVGLILLTRLLWLRARRRIEIQGG